MAPLAIAILICDITMQRRFEEKTVINYGDNDENLSDLACRDDEGVQPHTTVTVAVFSYNLCVFRTRT